MNTCTYVYVYQSLGCVTVKQQQQQQPSQQPQQQHGLRIQLSQVTPQVRGLKLRFFPQQIHQWTKTIVHPNTHLRESILSFN